MAVYSLALKHLVSGATRLEPPAQCWTPRAAQKDKERLPKTSLCQLFTESTNLTHLWECLNSQFFVFTIVSNLCLTDFCIFSFNQNSHKGVYYITNDVGPIVKRGQKVEHLLERNRTMSQDLQSAQGNKTPSQIPGNIQTINYQVRF